MTEKKASGGGNPATPPEAVQKHYSFKDNRDRSRGMNLYKICLVVQFIYADFDWLEVFLKCTFNPIAL